MVRKIIIRRSKPVDTAAPAKTEAPAAASKSVATNEQDAELVKNAVSVYFMLEGFNRVHGRVLDCVPFDILGSRSRSLAVSAISIVGDLHRKIPHAPAPLLVISEATRMIEYIGEIHRSMVRLLNDYRRVDTHRMDMIWGQLESFRASALSVLDYLSATVPGVSSLELLQAVRSELNNAG